MRPYTSPPSPPRTDFSAFFTGLFAGNNTPKRVLAWSGQGIPDLRFIDTRNHQWKWNGWTWEPTNDPFDPNNYRMSVDAMGCLYYQPTIQFRDVDQFPMGQALGHMLGAPQNPQVDGWKRRLPVVHIWYKRGHCFEVNGKTARYLGSCVDDPCEQLDFEQLDSNSSYAVYLRKDNVCPVACAQTIIGHYLTEMGEQWYSGKVPSVRYPIKSGELEAATAFFNAYREGTRRTSAHGVSGLVFLTADESSAYVMNSDGTWRKATTQVPMPKDGQSTFWAATPEGTIILMADQGTGAYELGKYAAEAAGTLLTAMDGGEAVATVYKPVIPEFDVWYGTSCYHYKQDKMEYLGSVLNTRNITKTEIQENFGSGSIYQFDGTSAWRTWREAVRELIKGDHIPYFEQLRDQEAAACPVRFSYRGRDDEFKAAALNYASAFLAASGRDSWIPSGLDGVFFKYNEMLWFADGGDWTTQSNDHLPGAWVEVEGVRVNIPFDVLNRFMLVPDKLAVSVKGLINGQGSSKTSGGNVLDSLFASAAQTAGDQVQAYLHYPDGRILVYKNSAWELSIDLPQGDFKTAMVSGYVLGYKDGVDLRAIRAKLQF